MTIEEPIVINILPGHPELTCEYCECAEGTNCCNGCGQPAGDVIRIQGVNTEDIPVCEDHLSTVINTVGRLLAQASQGLEQAA